ncbi:sce7726 family protein [Pseudomonas viridiflava]|uniref:sce7726 family protein n=1 Tax=Pseudomonas viridiflava TaxID=33069 RepID=UPI000F024C1E|nr:sce7726 family protein [Pseudomonas viridiflava]WKW31835.1 sce7726 family protein [Pseudomonas viridiflava]
MESKSKKFRNYAKILNRPTFLALARGVPPQDVFYDFDKLEVPKDVKTVKELFEFAFKTIQKNYRNEYIYKTAIANRIVFGRHSPKTSAISVEMPVGRSIADLAIFNGTSTVYEIKTELDSPRRLLSQTPDYLKAFEYAYIVTHPKLAEKYADFCNDNIGVLSINSKDSLSLIKPAKSNFDTLEPSVIFRMLRKYEIILAIKKITGEPIDIANGIVREHCQKIFENLDKKTAYDIYVEAMKKRTTESDFVDFLMLLPKHLRILAYATNLSKPQKQRLLASLELPLP